MPPEQPESDAPGPPGRSEDLPPIDIDATREILPERLPRLVQSGRGGGIPGAKGAAEGVGQSTVPRTFAHYEILGELGRGAMGIVYKARDSRLGRLVALKVLIAGEAASEAELARFFREASAAAKLRHPNIVPIHDLGVHEGRHYFTMDFVEGRPLSAVLREGRLDARRAL